MWRKISYGETDCSLCGNSHRSRPYFCHQFNSTKGRVLLAVRLSSHILSVLSILMRILYIHLCRCQTYSNLKKFVIFYKMQKLIYSTGCLLGKGPFQSPQDFQNSYTFTTMLIIVLPKSKYDVLQAKFRTQNIFIFPG